MECITFIAHINYKNICSFIQFQYIESFIQFTKLTTTQLKFLKTFICTMVLNCGSGCSCGCCDCGHCACYDMHCGRCGVSFNR